VISRQRCGIDTTVVRTSGVAGHWRVSVSRTNTGLDCRYSLIHVSSTGFTIRGPVAVQNKLSLLRSELRETLLTSGVSQEQLPL